MTRYANKMIAAAAAALLALSIVTMLLSAEASAADMVSFNAETGALKKPAATAPSNGKFKAGEKAVIIGETKNPGGVWYFVRTDSGACGWANAAQVKKAGQYETGPIHIYSNSRYPFKVSVPTSVTIQEESQNGDGTMMTGKNIDIVAYGANLIEETKSYATMEYSMNNEKGYSWNIAVKGSSNNCDWYIISGVKNGKVLWIKSLSAPADEICSQLRIEYPASAKAAVSKTVSTALATFQMGASAPKMKEPDVPKSVRSFPQKELIQMVKNSKYYKNGKTFGRVFDSFFEKPEWTVKYFSNPLIRPDEMVEVLFTGFAQAVTGSKVQMKISFEFYYDEASDKLKLGSLSYAMGGNNDNYLEGLPDTLLYELK